MTRRSPRAGGANSTRRPTWRTVKGSSWAMLDAGVLGLRRRPLVLHPADDTEPPRRLPRRPRSDQAACAPSSTLSRSFADSRLSTLPAAETGIASMNTTSRSRFTGSPCRPPRPSPTRRSAPLPRRRPCGRRRRPAASRSPRRAARPPPAGHAGHAGQDLLELAQEDVVAVVEQHALGWMDDQEVAVLVEGADVAGVKPASASIDSAVASGRSRRRASPAGRGEARRARPTGSGSPPPSGRIRISVSNVGTPTVPGLRVLYGTTVPVACMVTSVGP